MKVCHDILVAAGLAVLFTSCASTLPAEKERSLQVHNAPVAEENVEVIEEKQIEPDELYAQSITMDLKLSLVSEPGTVNVNRKFQKPYVFMAQHADGTPWQDFELEVTWPSAKKQGKIEYTTQILKTDSEGLISFIPGLEGDDGTARFSASDSVRVRPAMLYETEAVALAVQSWEVRASYRVRSDIASRGAVLFVWDFNEKGRPTNNSTDVQSEFRSRGVTMVGNGPVNDTSYIGKNTALYRDTYEIIGGDAYGYLISGTIKFERPVEPDGDEYVCAMVAEITGIRMKDGEQVFYQTFTNEAHGKNWNACTSKCKEDLSKQIVDALIFGL